MVRLEKNKIIIEIETNLPIEDYQELQKEIICIVQNYNYKDCGSVDGCPFSRLLDLLQATFPEDSFYDNLLKNNN